MISVAFVGLTMNVRADDRYTNNQTQIALTSNNYPGGVPADWYAPGDAITGTLTGMPSGGLPPPADGIEDTLDVVAADDDGAGVCDAFVLANIRLQANNIVLDPVSGLGTFSLPGTSTRFLSDGYYCAWVAPGDYIEGVSPNAYRGVRFQIHEYRIVASTDRGGYIPGNTVKVFYSVSNITDGSPVTMTGYEGEWLVQSTAGGETYDYEALTEPAGQFSFTISNTGGISPGETYPVYIWFNSTPGGAIRRDTKQLNVLVGNLDARISIPSGPTVPDAGSLMLVEVVTEVIVPGPNPRYPGATVQIKILDGPTPTSLEMTAYTKTFTSDGSGLVDYNFILDTAVFLDGKTYTISVNATSVLKYDSDLETFSVMETLVKMSIQLTLDKLSYYSGESVVMTVAAQPPAGHGQPTTYIYQVTSSGGSLVYANEFAVTSPYTFLIPSDFQGTMTFRADVYNDEGDYGWDSEDRTIQFGVMIVNVRPAEYNANDQLTADFELKSTVMTASTTTFYYTIHDGARYVKQDIATVSSGSLSGSIQYTVPNVPAQQYTFTVYASGGGHIVSGQAAANLIHDFILTIKFDKTNYNPGDTMVVDYKIAARASGTPLPRIFTFGYGLLGYPAVTLTTTNAEGKVNYVVPAGANEGPVLFEMMEGSTNTVAIEVVTIGPPTDGIELFDAFLLVLIVILFLLVLAMRGRGAGAGAGAPKPKEEKAAPPPPPGQQVSPMIVNCKACGAPIELTTSKRPIEVMCPSCGETAMVQ